MNCSGCTDTDAFNFGCHDGEIPPCNDDITIDDGSCIYYPEEFQFNQSQMQAFYIVENAEIQQEEYKDLEIFTDWIGVFKDSVCVGAYPWVGIGTTIPTMGDDGTSLTENYLLAGDYPTFHIYDGSEGEYINTEVIITPIAGGEYTGWVNFGFYFIEEMFGSVMDWYSIALDGVDLISFYSLPENDSVATIFSQIEDSNPKILGEGTSAFYYGEYPDGVWLGTLTEIKSTDGYWVIIDAADTLDIIGIPTDSNIVYDLHLLTNLISYPFAGFAPVGETIPDSAQGFIDAILGEGVAAMNTSDGWVGGLLNLSGTEGYWFITNAEVSFSYNPPVEGATRKASPIRSVPMEFAFKQSTQQAFYFVNSATIDGEPLEKEDLIIAYNDDMIVGSRYWYGEITDVPAMGYDPNNYEKYTAGYCKAGDQVTFKVLDASTGKLIEMEADGDISWENNLIWFVATLENVVAIPADFHLGKPYPNPFNPVATITYDVPLDCEIELSIYDLQGRLVEQLISGYMEAGYYELQWNAGTASSGIYFLRLTALEQAITRKLILMK